MGKVRLQQVTDVADYLKDFIRLNANIRDIPVDSVPDQSHSSVVKGTRMMGMPMYWPDT